jgi:FkbM family methyltransferase
VVGVEANPLLTAQCALRFENEIRLGRVRIINAGVLKEPGKFTFYRNLRDDGSSTFQLERRRERGEWEELKIPCVTTQQLIADAGRPFFMKVDIEGADLQALLSITPATASAYVSLELNCADPILERLIELGYSAFKFVNGETHWSAPPIFDHQVGWRILRKIGRFAPFVRKGSVGFRRGFVPSSSTILLASTVPPVIHSGLGPVRRAGRRLDSGDPPCADSIYHDQLVFIAKLFVNVLGFGIGRRHDRAPASNT